MTSPSRESWVAAGRLVGGTAVIIVSIVAVIAATTWFSNHPNPVVAVLGTGGACIGFLTGMVTLMAYAIQWSSE